MPCIGNFSLGNSSVGQCSANQSELQSTHPWLFAPSSLNSLLCLGSADFCDVIQQRNCHFAATLRPYSTAFCAFNALNIVSNALSFAVFSKQDVSSGTVQCIVVLLLKALSLLEILFHFFFLMYHITEYSLFSSALSFSGIDSSIVFCVLINLLIVLQTSFHIGRNWLVVLISTFRFEAVCRAMKPVKVFSSVSRVHAILAAIVVASLAISMPRFFYFTCVACQRPDGVYSLDSLDMRMRQPFYSAFNNIYLIGALLLFQTGGPILVVCYFSARIILGLRRHRRFQQSLRKNASSYSASQGRGSSARGGGGGGQSSQQGTRGNLLVIILCVTFLVLEFPLFISKIVDGRISNKKLDALIVGMSKFATLLDSFLNIFIYCISNSRFRQDLYELVKLPACRRRCAAAARRNRAGGDAYKQRQAAIDGETIALRPISRV
ncbi:hypothetical protein BOX15_Mlig023911g3 [Macrostomum lignano]|uniref:G-protein coupled receptors family 1 profile domain-containing protein n=1 Tax=Macrostomum lignano TaxID=282301 RepID=A0A267DFU1_9PLAT|nr:hypothetical protein BOX15_Mlig023911g3 [Macrostomum lignano]